MAKKDNVDTWFDKAEKIVTRSKKLILMISAALAAVVGSVWIAMEQFSSGESMQDEMYSEESYSDEYAYEEDTMYVDSVQVDTLY